MLADWINNTIRNVIEKGEVEVGTKPTYGSQCQVNLSVQESTLQFCQSLYIPTISTEQIITIGNAESILDQYIEYWITQMNPMEKSSFSLKMAEFYFHLIVTLIKFSGNVYIFERNAATRYKEAINYKTKGVELFKGNRIADAFYKFSQALKLVLVLPYSEELTNLKTTIYNNMANCQLKFNNVEYCTALCTKSINLNPNVKAYYRRALAHIQVGLYDKAEEDLHALLKIEENNSAALNKLQEIQLLDKINRENYKKTVKRMFQ